MAGTSGDPEPEPRHRPRLRLLRGIPWPRRPVAPSTRWTLRAVAVALNLVLISCLAIVKWQQDHPPPPPLTTVQVAAGSEDLPYLTSAAVTRRFAQLGLKVMVSAFGSGQIAEDVPRAGYDAFFVSSQVFSVLAQNRLRQTLATSQPFTTPLEVFTWTKLDKPLRALGIINSQGRFDVDRYLRVIDSKTRWNSVGGRPLGDDDTQVVLQTTDPTQSDSGAMFMAAVTYALNGHNVLSTTDPATVSRIARRASTVINPLGQMVRTTNELFMDYRREGMNGVPMILGYQSEAKQLPSGGVAVPLAETIDCEHTVVPLDPVGIKFRDALNDQVMQELAAKSDFTTDTTANGSISIPVPAAPVLKILLSDLGSPGGS